MAKLDAEMKKSDDLLGQMMPKSVAEKIKVTISSLSFTSNLSRFPRMEPLLLRPVKFSKW